MHNLNKGKLLTKGIASPKLAKDQTYTTYILYLASAVYKAELCPNAGDCKSFCLITKAGRGAIGGPDNAIQKARKRKSDWYLTNPESFKAQLVHEIQLAIRSANSKGEKLAIRLNGGSDLDWSDVYSQFPSVQFWEYTKRPDLAIKLNQLSNVHVTYSHNERTTDRILGSILSKGINIAMVFSTKKGKDLPANHGSLKVVDGDQSDLRFLDGQGVIVGLRLKSLRKVSPSQLQNQSFVSRI
jgi:hypothetical protein